MQALPGLCDSSATATVMTDYRYRGPSLTHGRPTLKLALAFDTDIGAYGGAQGAGVHYGAEPQWELELLAYAGIARRFGEGNSWEVGLMNATYTHQHDYDYRDWYAGVSTDTGLVSRLHYAHAYYGSEASAVYLEFDKSYRLTNDRALFGHVGITHLLPDNHADPTRRDFFDLRAGLAWDFERLHTELAWVTTNAARVILLGSTPRVRHGLELVVSTSF